MNIKQYIEKRSFSGCSWQPGMAFGRTWFELGRAIARIYSWSMFKLDIYYQVPPPSGTKILAANHPSTIDPVIMTFLVPEQVSILILDTLFKVPFFGASLRAAGHIRVNDGDGKKAIRDGLRRLDAGCTVGIFPEGVVTPKGNTKLHGHTGVARLAIASGAPVIPVGIHLEPGYIYHTKNKVKGEIKDASWYVHGPYSVTVGEPLVYHGSVEDKQYVREVTDQIMTRVGILANESAQRMWATRQIALSSRLIEAGQFLWALTRGAFRTI